MISEEILSDSVEAHTRPREAIMRVKQYDLASFAGLNEKTYFGEPFTCIFQQKIHKKTLSGRFGNVSEAS